MIKKRSLADIESQVIHLSPRDERKFVENLRNPPEPNKRLRDAFRKYHRENRNENEINPVKVAKWRKLMEPLRKKELAHSQPFMEASMKLLAGRRGIIAKDTARVKLIPADKDSAAAFLKTTIEIHQEASKLLRRAKNEIELATVAGLLQTCTVKLGNSLLAYKTGRRCADGSLDSFANLLLKRVRLPRIRQFVGHLKALRALEKRSRETDFRINRFEIHGLFRRSVQWVRWVSGIICDGST